MRGRDRELLASGSLHSRSRSESRCLSWKQRPATTLSIVSDHCSDVSNQGHSVRVFSRSAGAWLNGKIAIALDSDFVYVEYGVHDIRLGKTLHLHSPHLSIASSTIAHFSEQQPGEELLQVERMEKGAQELPCSGQQNMSTQSSALPKARIATGTPEPVLPVFQGCRRELPSGCDRDPMKYYIEMDYMWKLLELESVVLLRGGWLLEHSKMSPFEPLPCRQHLPSGAIADVKQVRLIDEMLQQERDQAVDSDYLSGFGSVIAISHCWLSPDHPDPHGNLLQELVPVIEIYRKTMWEQYHQCFDGAFFFAWCSIYQPYHAKGEDGCYVRLEKAQLTAEQQAAHQRALENMDIWYAHARTEVWMLTKFFEGQKWPYDKRGWPTWERTVAELLSGAGSVLDLGELKDGYQHRCNHMRGVRMFCQLQRRPPLSPEDFANIIEDKYFTFGNTDKNLVKDNYTRNFHQMMRCVTSLDCHGARFRPWGYEEIVSLSKALRHCDQLQRIFLGENDIGLAEVTVLATALGRCSQLRFLNIARCPRVDDDAAIVLFQNLRQCRQLQQLHLWRTSIGDTGIIELAKNLQLYSELHTIDFCGCLIADSGAIELAGSLSHCQCTQLQELALQDEISDAGVVALSDHLRFCGMLRELTLGHEIGDDGAAALADAIQHCRQLQRLDLFENQITDVGAASLAQALGCCDQMRMVQLASNQIGYSGMIALINAHHSLGHRPIMQLSNNRIDPGAVALVRALTLQNSAGSIGIIGNIEL